MLDAESGSGSNPVAPIFCPMTFSRSKLLRAKAIGQFHFLASLAPFRNPTQIRHRRAVALGPRRYCFGTSAHTIHCPANRLAGEARGSYGKHSLRQRVPALFHSLPICRPVVQAFPFHFRAEDRFCVPGPRRRDPNAHRCRPPRGASRCGSSCVHPLRWKARGAGCSEEAPYANPVWTAASWDETGIGQR